MIHLLLSFLEVILVSEKQPVFLYLSFLSCKDDLVEDICPKANYQSWNFSLDLFRFLRFLIGWLVWNSNADSKWQKCMQRRFATRTWEKNENVTFAIDSVWSLFLIIGMQTHFAPLKSFCLCAVCVKRWKIFYMLKHWKTYCDVKKGDKFNLLGF